MGPLSKLDHLQTHAKQVLERGVGALDLAIDAELPLQGLAPVRLIHEDAHAQNLERACLGAGGAIRDMFRRGQVLDEVPLWVKQAARTHREAHEKEARASKHRSPPETNHRRHPP